MKWILGRSGQDGYWWHVTASTSAALAASWICAARVIDVIAMGLTFAAKLCGLRAAEYQSVRVGGIWACNGPRQLHRPSYAAGPRRFGQERNFSMRWSRVASMALAARCARDSGSWESSDEARLESIRAITGIARSRR